MKYRSQIVCLGLPLALVSCATPTRSTIDEFKDAHSEFFRGATSMPLVRATATRLDGGEIHDEPGSFDFDELEIDAFVPVPISRDEFLVTGMFASRRSYSFDGPALEDEDLGILALRIGYGRFLSDDLAVQAYAEPSVYSDFDGSLQNRDYRLWYGTALAIWRARPDLFWKVGFQLNDVVDTAVIPLVGATWHITEKFRFEALVPRDVRLVYLPNDHWHLSGGILNKGYEYHVRGPLSLGSPEHDVHTQETALFLRAERLWNGGLSTFARVGTPIKGTYDWDYGGGFPEYEGDLDRGTMMTVGLGYRF